MYKRQVYITCFDSHIEFSSKFKNGITVEYGKKFEAPKINAYVRGRLINRKGKEIKCTIDSNVDGTKTGSYEIKVTAQYGKMCIRDSHGTVGLRQDHSHEYSGLS